jgi:acyl carrier protein
MNDSQRQLAERIIAGLNLEDLTPADIDPQAPLFGEGLKLDSIDALELAVIVERHYKVRIPNMEVGKQAFASVAALDSFIRGATPDAASTVPKVPAAP